GEALRGVSRRPATGVLERLRQVPVVERRTRLDAPLEHRLDEAAVEVESGLVCGAPARRLDPRPSDREAQGAQPELHQQVKVALIAVIEVAGDVAAVAAAPFARRVAEG